MIDRLGNKTAYEYDASGRVTRVANTGADGTAYGTVDYTYDECDNLTAITRGDGMQYALAYDTFRNLASIGIAGKAENLVEYTYKNGSGRLKEIAYANGDKMTATYNGLGQMVAEKWYNASNELTAHYKYVYDNDGNIVRSIDILASREYTYTYEEGVLTRAAEYRVTVGANELITARTLLHSVCMVYNGKGTLVKKEFTAADGTTHTVTFTNEENGSTAAFTVGDTATVCTSATDHFGRKTSDELRLNETTLSRVFAYHEGETPQEHIDGDKVPLDSGENPLAPTTQLVSSITFSDGRTIAYEYDAEERITKVTDSVDGVTEYTYDALGQLLTERVNGKLVNRMTYDSYGNILSKNGVRYVYDEVWRDKLIAYGDETCVYDAQGNPATYRGHALMWEKGRQLKSFDNIQYTYNANGIRTSKTVNGVKHAYTLDGAKILREVWGGNVLMPLYDNEDSVCGIAYNGTPYYFIKNLQGDIIAITDSTGAVKARYSYDAWGVCKVKSDASGCDIAKINPFRYRGYYYDVDTCVYYLQSRYYDPYLGRFINADEAEMILLLNDSVTSNAFLYCENCMTCSADPTGLVSLNSVKNKCLEFINKIKNKLNKITESLRIQYSTNYISLPTPALAIAIDSIVFAISKISHFAIKTLLKVFIAWAKSNTKSFARFVRQYLIENCRKILLSLISFLMKKFAQKRALEKMKNKISSAVFGDSLLFRIYSAFSSIGNIVATLLDIMDGYWDDKMRIKV